MLADLFRPDLQREISPRLNVPRLTRLVPRLGAILAGRRIPAQNLEISCLIISRRPL